MRALLRHRRRGAAVALAALLVAAGCGAPAGEERTADDPDARPAGPTQEPDDVPPGPDDDPPGQPDGTVDTPDADAATEDEGVAPTASEALDVRGRTLDGGRFDGHEVAGGHVVLWMWAPW